MNGTEAKDKAGGPSGELKLEVPSEVLKELVEKARLQQVVNVDLPNWSVEVEKTTKGYKWLVKGRGDVPEDVLAKLFAIENQLRDKFGEPDNTPDAPDRE